MVRTYIDELKDGIRFSSGGPVSISLETAKRLVELYLEAAYEATHQMGSSRLLSAVNSIKAQMPEPKP